MLHCARCDQLIHPLQKRASATAIILLSLAVFVAFWNWNAQLIHSPVAAEGNGRVKLRMSASFGLQREGLLQWGSSKINGGREHVSAQPWESVDDSDGDDGLGRSVGLIS